MRSLLGSGLEGNVTSPGNITDVILAGGFGARLHPVVNDRPKMLGEVKGRPLLSYLFDQLENLGIRDAVIQRLATCNIAGRPVVYPMHNLPPYQRLVNRETFPVAERISRCGINLPTWAGLNEKDVRHVCESLMECLSETKALREEGSRT